MLFPIMQVKDSGSLIVIKHHMPEFWYDIYIMARIARLASNSSFMICLNNVVLLQHSRRVCDTIREYCLRELQFLSKIRLHYIPT